jgi:hypothetical protein
MPPIEVPRALPSWRKFSDRATLEEVNGFFDQFRHSTLAPCRLTNRERDIPALDMSASPPDIDPAAKRSTL